MCNKYVDSATFENKVEEAKKKNDIRVKKQQEINVLDNKIISNNAYIDKIYEYRLKNNIYINMFNQLSIKYKYEI